MILLHGRLYGVRNKNVGLAPRPSCKMIIVAIAQASGPQAGLDIVLPLFDVAELRKYYRYVPFDKLRAHKSRRRVADDLLCRIGEHDPARKQFLSAAALTSNTPERATMQRRAAQHENEILSNRLNPI